MTDRELIARRLAGQHLTAPTDALTAAGAGQGRRRAL